MDRGAWQATVLGSQRAGRDRAHGTFHINIYIHINIILYIIITVVYSISLHRETLWEGSSAFLPSSEAIDSESLVSTDSAGASGGTSDKEPTCQCRRHKRCEFDPWVEKIPWRRAWQPTPVILPGESHGPGILTGYGPKEHKESDTTEVA